MARISISLNEVLRDFVGQFAYTYNKYIAESDITEDDVTTFDLIKYFPFDSVDKLNSFLYLEAPLEIFGHADVMTDRLMDYFNEIEDDGEHQIEIVSREVSKAIPSTLFFLSKTGCRATNIRFVTNYEDKWDNADILITANPRTLENKPSDKISVKVNTKYNQDVQSDYSINSILDFINNTELRAKILTKTITTTYEEIK